jgi:hypothetical protein
MTIYRPTSHRSKELSMPSMSRALRLLIVSVGPCFMLAAGARAQAETAGVVKPREGVNEAVLEHGRAADAFDLDGKFQQAFLQRQLAIERARQGEDPRQLADVVEIQARTLSNDDRLSLPQAQLAVLLWTEASENWERAGEQKRATLAALQAAIARTWTDQAGLEEARRFQRELQESKELAADAEVAELAALADAWIRCAASDAQAVDVSTLFEPVIASAGARGNALVLGRALRARGRYLLPENSAFGNLAMARQLLQLAAQEFKTCGSGLREAEALEDLARSYHPAYDRSGAWDQAFAAYRAAADAWLRLGRFDKCAELGVVGLLCKNRGNWSRVPATELSLLTKFARFAARGGDKQLEKECNELYFALARATLPGAMPQRDASGHAAGPCQACGGAGHFPPGIFGPQPTPCLTCNMTGRSG